MRTRVVLCLMILATACATTPAIFRVEPLRQVSFGLHEPLQPGTLILFEIGGLAPDEIFHVSRCGIDCSTAKTMLRVRGRDSASRQVIYDAEQGGRYYFWIQRRTETGESGPVRVSRFDATGDEFSALFDSGATVSGGLQPLETERETP